MKEMRLSLYELTFIAELTQKTIHTLPDVYGRMPPTEQGIRRQTALRGLLEKKLVFMNFDGNQTLATSAMEFLAPCLDSDGFLMLRGYNPDSGRGHTVIWRRNGNYLLASAIGSDYNLVKITPAEIKGITDNIFPEQATRASNGNGVEVPQLTLDKAKRAVERGDEESALKLLQQSVTDGRLLTDIISALHGRLAFRSVTQVDTNPEGISISRLVLRGRFGYMLCVSEVKDFRTVVRFSYENAQELKRQLSGELDSFLVEA